MQNKKVYMLLIVFFVTYIATGGVFALLGSAWPAISADLAVPMSWQSILITVIHTAGAMGAASAQRMSARFGNWAPVSLILLILTAVIFGFSMAGSFSVMPLLGVAMGYFLAMSSTLINGYAARNYKAIYMTWLHCFFSLGSTISPAILSYFIINSDSWRMGYQANGLVTGSVLVIVLLSFPLWRAHGDALFPGRTPALGGAGGGSASEGGAPAPAKVKSVRELMRLPGGTIIPVTMFFYCSVEITIMFWMTSYLTDARGLTPGIAASLMSIVFGAQVAGRIIGGFITLRVSSRLLIRIGMVILICTSIVFVFSPDAWLAPILALFGFAMGPNYPLILFETPSIVGKENSQGVIGLQMASANISSASVPLLTGAVANRFGFGVFPYFLIALTCLAFVFKLVQDRTVSASK